MSGVGTAYEIGVQGRIDDRWGGWFAGLNLTYGVDGSGEAITLLRGRIADQSALRGLLSRIWDLNLTLISLTRLNEPQAQSGGQSSE